MLQEEHARLYSNLFRLLWKSTLPCYPSSSSTLSMSTHLLRQCRSHGQRQRQRTKRHCRWEGKQVNCSEIFTPVITDSGVCCAFNLQDHLKESAYGSLVKEMQVETWQNSFIFCRQVLELLKWMRSRTSDLELIEASKLSLTGILTGGKESRRHL